MCRPANGQFEAILAGMFGALAVVVIAVGTLSAVLVGYAVWMVGRPALGGPAEALRDPRQPGVLRVVCAGDSLTHGTMSFDYVQALRERLPTARLFNAGVNGDLAFNLAERLPEIVACDPDVVVVLIGTNDLCGAENPAVAMRQRRQKRLPQMATQDFFEAQLQRLLVGLAAQTKAKVIVVTPPLLGEDLTHGAHARLLALAARADEIARRHGATVVPFHEAMASALVASGHVGRPGFHAGARELTWMAMVPLQRHLLGWSYDRIAASHGLWGSADLLHLTERSGGILVELLVPLLRA
jgi:lysophospholipase L1-like esterase